MGEVTEGKKMNVLKKGGVSDDTYMNVGIEFFYRGLMLSCLMPFSTIFQLYRGRQFYLWRKPEYSEKHTDLPHVTDKLYHIMFVSSTPSLSGIKNHSISGDRH
jgi:hypothetical protein